jgi:hypothetical protein
MPIFLFLFWATVPLSQSPAFADGENLLLLGNGLFHGHIHSRSMSGLKRKSVIVYGVEQFNVHSKVNRRRSL